MSTLRSVDLRQPHTWEFSGFSQNGEDGVIDVLARHIKEPNRYFIEIGASDGLENNTSWLAMAARWSGLWVEGDRATSRRSARIFTKLNYGLEFICMFVDADTIKSITDRALFRNPDVFSLDVDGIDYHLAHAALTRGLRPKIFVVEYNSAFGPSAAVTIPYTGDFKRGDGANDDLYYGCSIAAWQVLFSSFGYRFVTVESNGVNAFFIDPDQIDARLIDEVQGSAFRENVAQLRQHRVTHREQVALVAHRPLVQVKA